MKINEPVGDSSYAPLFLRLALGGYFVVAGFAKLDHIGGFVEEVQQFHVLPHQFATLYGILLPYLEVTVGGLLLLGVWTTLASILASIMLVSFVFAFGVFPHSGRIFNKDLILLAGSLSLMFSGAGAFSYDKMRRTAE